MVQNLFYQKANFILTLSLFLTRTFNLPTSNSNGSFAAPQAILPTFLGVKQISATVQIERNFKEKSNIKNALKHSNSLLHYFANYSSLFL